VHFEPETFGGSLARLRRPEVSAAFRVFKHFGFTDLLRLWQATFPNELSDLCFLKGLAMKHSVLLVAMIAALGLTACAEEAEEPVAAGESEVLGEEAGGGAIFEDSETSAIVEEGAETSGGIVGEEETEAGRGRIVE
jgi:hypothetical protein